LGDFRKFLATKFIAKEAQMIGNFLGNFEKPHSYVKTDYWLLFYSNIWSPSSITFALNIFWKT